MPAEPCCHAPWSSVAEGTGAGVARRWRQVGHAEPRARPSRSRQRGAATYQGAALVLTIPGRGPLFGPAGHFTLQDRRRAHLK